MGIKSAFWKPHLDGWRDSGLSQAAYCRQHALSVKCFAYWRRTLGSTLGVASMPAVVPIMVRDAPAADDHVEVRLPNGLQVRLSAGLDPARLVPTIRALWSC